MKVSAAFFLVLSLMPFVSHAEGWLDHVTEIQEAQPHWVTPLATTTPRLEQEFRSDFVDQETTTSGHQSKNYGNGKGLELIPFDPVEVIFNAPGYITHSNSKVKDGFGDSALLVKYRILSAPKSDGDYILSVFFGASLPTAQYKNGSPASIFTPSISGGKGWGDFDVQSTLGLAIPDIQSIGPNIQWNTAFQYRVETYYWPELEFNYTRNMGGPDNGETQLFITPGVVIGRLPIHNRIGFTIGAGMQIAATDYHHYDHAWVISARLPF